MSLFFGIILRNRQIFVYSRNTLNECAKFGRIVVLSCIETNLSYIFSNRHPQLDCYLKKNRYHKGFLSLDYSVKISHFASTFPTLSKSLLLPTVSFFARPIGNKCIGGITYKYDSK